MRKILIVDDDPDILEAIKIIVESEGYNAEVTTRAREAIRIVQDFKPDLIILDVLLSGDDGRVICKSLKTDERTKDIPIIMISAHPSAKKSVKESGANSFVPKPFSIEELVYEVQKHIKTQ